MTRNPSIGGEPRDGERRMDFDPAGLSGDARLVFIGSVRSPWGDRAECPKNMAQARERGIEAAIWLAPPYRAGLMGLDGFAPGAIELQDGAAGDHWSVFASSMQTGQFSGFLFCDRKLGFLQQFLGFGEFQFPQDGSFFLRDLLLFLLHLPQNFGGVLKFLFQPGQLI